MEELTRTQARELLTSWQRAREQVDEDRDPVVLAALVAGLEKKEIFQLTGIARSTINRIEIAARGNGVTGDE